MKIAFVSVYVLDLDGMKDFYTKYFGTKVDDKYENSGMENEHCFLSFDDGARLLLIRDSNIVESKNDDNFSGLSHISITVDGGKEKVDALTSQLKADGFKVIGEPRATGDGHYESCILDIEGNQVEITT